MTTMLPNSLEDSYLRVLCFCEISSLHWHSAVSRRPYFTPSPIARLRVVSAQEPFTLHPAQRGQYSPRTYPYKLETADKKYYSVMDD